MFRYFISFCLVLASVGSFSQEKKAQDSTVYKTGYGLRLGIDISKPIMGMINSSYSGIEFVADYRIKKNWYIAAEFGTQEEVTVEDYTKLMEEEGFKNVSGEDRTDIFIQTLKHELNNLEKSTLLKQEKNNLYKIWQDKFKRAERGEQCWGWFSGEKSK